MIALTLEDYEPLVLPLDEKQPPESRRTFYLRPLPERQMTQVLNIMGQSFGLSFLSGRISKDLMTQAVNLGDLADVLLRFGIAGWRNAKDARGAIVEPKKEPDGGLNLEPLTLTIFERGILFNEVFSKLFFSEEEAKNLQELSSSPERASA